MPRKRKGKPKLKHPPHLRVKGLLVERGLKQKDIADLLNLNVATVNQKLNGYLHFTFAEVEKICFEYDVRPDIFLQARS